MREERDATRGEGCQARGEGKMVPGHCGKPKSRFTRHAVTNLFQQLALTKDKTCREKVADSDSHRHSESDSDSDSNFSKRHFVVSC